MKYNRNAEEIKMAMSADLRNWAKDLKDQSDALSGVAGYEQIRSEIMADTLVIVSELSRRADCNREQNDNYRRAK
jgi:hypothetical protein